MTAHVKNILLASAVFLFSLFLLVPSVHAAAPDGMGPWADSVLSTSQGLEKGGGAVPAIRSDPTSALGVAENDTVDGHFYSLGFGGNIALGFDNGISSGVIVVEATNVGYPSETAKVEVSENGTTWVTAGNLTEDGQVNKPAGITCARYVRITDTSNKDNFTDATADGYDVDGVKATGDPCTPPAPAPTPTCCPSCSNVTQNNKTVVNTTVISGTNTGGNNSSFNTGGSNTIKTGSSVTTTSVNVGGNTNTNSSQCCTTGGSTNVTISGNGSGSHNTVVIATPKTPTSKLKKF